MCLAQWTHSSGLMRNTAQGCRSIWSQTSPGNGVNTIILSAQSNIQANVPLAPQPHCADICHLSIVSLWLSSSPVRKVGADVNDGPEASWDGMGYPTPWQGACDQGPVNTALLHARCSPSASSNMTNPCTPSKSVENNRSAPIIPFSPAQDCD